MKYAAKTDIGKRDTNEDSFLIPAHDSKLPLFAVSDGMGGYLAGEVASRMVTDGLLNEFTDNGMLVSERTLRNAIRNINVSVYRLANTDATKKGMGATLVCAYIGIDRVLAANVGDSRLYLVRDGSINRITKDQSFVQALIDSGAITEADAKTHPRRNCILQAVGANIGISPDFYSFDKKAGDRLILCSDGLCGIAEDADILKIALENTEPDACAEALVRHALALHGTDNVTVVVVDTDEEVGE